MMEFIISIPLSEFIHFSDSNHGSETNFPEAFSVVYFIKPLCRYFDSEMGHDMFYTNKSCIQVHSIRPSNSGLPKCKSWSKSGYANRGSCHIPLSTRASFHIFCSVLNSASTNQLTLYCYVVQLLNASFIHLHMRK
jgi:hypothetical protein